jgi:hypothetical protein
VPVPVPEAGTRSGVGAGFGDTVGEPSDQPCRGGDDAAAGEGAVEPGGRGRLAWTTRMGSLRTRVTHNNPATANGHAMTSTDTSRDRKPGIKPEPIIRRRRHSPVAGMTSSPWKPPDFARARRRRNGKNHLPVLFHRVSIYIPRPAHRIRCVEDRGARPDAALAALTPGPDHGRRGTTGRDH